MRRSPPGGEQKPRGTLKVVAVKAPGFGDRCKGDAPRHRRARRRQVILGGGRLQAGERHAQRPGRKRSSVDKDNTTLVDGKGKESDIQGRINEIKAAIEKTTSDYDREKLQSAWPSSPAAWR